MMDGEMTTRRTGTDEAAGLLAVLQGPLRSGCGCQLTLQKERPGPA